MSAAAKASRESGKMKIADVTEQRRLREAREAGVKERLFDGDRYSDIVAEYDKASPEDILIRITAHNRAEARLIRPQVSGDRHDE